MGAMFIQRYLQEFPDTDILQAVSTISSPWNVSAVAKHFHEDFIIRKVILYSQQDLLRSHLHEENFLKQLEDKKICPSKFIVNEDELLQATTCNTFFEKMTNEYDLNHVEEYWARLSSHSNVSKLKIPMLNIQSKDDGICAYKNVPIEELKQNSKIITVSYNAGGTSPSTLDSIQKW